MSSTSPPNQKQSQLMRCDAELAAAESALREGHPDVEGLALAISDWAEERRILEKEESS